MIKAIVRPTLAEGLRERLAGAAALLVIDAVQREHPAVTLLAHQLRRRSTGDPGASPASRV
jgi:hypothetical protein